MKCRASSSSQGQWSDRSKVLVVRQLAIFIVQVSNFTVNKLLIIRYLQFYTVQVSNHTVSEA